MLRVLNLFHLGKIWLGEGRMKKAAHGGLADDQGCLAERYVEHVSSRMI